MIWHIARRELLDNLMSLRFSLTIALVGALMIAASLLFIGAYGQRVSDYDNDRTQRRQEVEDASKQAWWGLIDLISWRRLQWVRMSPNPTDFLAGGGDRDVPNSFGVGAFRTEGPALRARANFMLPGFSEMDWSFIVGVVLSFVALIFTYDAISGSKERGTLRLTLAQPVPRSDILLGKYVAAMLSVAIPFVFGILLHLLIVTNSPLIGLDRSDWIKVLLVILVSLIYLSAFVLIGLFVSARTHRTSTSFVILLLVWALLVVVIPGNGGLLAHHFFPETPSMRALILQTSAHADDVLARLRSPNVFWSGDRPISFGIQVGDAWVQGLDAYRRIMINEVRLARHITRVSPRATYQYACEAISGTGFPRFLTFYAQAKAYKGELLEFVRGEYAKREARHREHRPYDFDPSVFPEFTERIHTHGEAAGTGLWDVFLLLLFNVIFFMGAYASFLRYDVR